MSRPNGVPKSMSGHFPPTNRLAFIKLIMLACFLAPLLAACSSVQLSPTQPSAGTSSQSSGNANGVSPTPTSASSVPLNTTIIYASTKITIIDAKQAQKFSDDTNTTSDLLRLDLKETNLTATTSYYSYDSAARLLLPDGTEVAPQATEDNAAAIDASIVRNNWIDFPVSMSIKISQLSLQLGRITEAQELIPLTAGANVSKYNASSASPNATMTYGKIDWTVTTATSELSYAGKQADKGMMFVVVDLNANNKSSTGGGGDLVQVRLKSGATINPAQEFLNTVAGNQTNVKSTVSFMMPQGSTSFTLIFLPSNAYGITTQSSVDFQIA